MGTKSRSVAFGVGVSTYALRGIRVRGVENPQGFGVMNADLMCRNILKIRDCPLNCDLSVLIDLLFGMMK
ncbi:MAG: hypothetical protein KKG76_05390 [Euryarchaeota archaeon]|nr:hypothetical protein [Euryarchaeota archaeon]